MKLSAGRTGSTGKNRHSRRSGTLGQVRNTGPAGIHIQHVRCGEADENHDDHDVDQDIDRDIDYAMPEPPVGDDPECE